MFTLERVATGVNVAEFDGSDWYRDLIDNRDDLIIWSHTNNVDIDIDKLFPMKGATS